MEKNSENWKERLDNFFTEEGIEISPGQIERLNFLVGYFLKQQTDYVSDSMVEELIDFSRNMKL